MAFYGIRVKQVQWVTSVKGWGLNGNGFSQAYIRQVIDESDKRQCSKITDLIDTLIRRAEYIYDLEAL